MSHRTAVGQAVKRPRVALAFAAVFAVLAGLLAPLFAPATSAQAAGTAVLDVSIEAVDSATSAPQSDASFGAHRDSVAYKVAYSCAAADCADTTVRLSPSQRDPYGLSTEPMLSYGNWTPPAGLPGASIDGTDVTGKTVRLGELSAGRSGTFLVVYDIFAEGTYTTPRPAQYYPSGFKIQMSATISASSAVGPAKADAQPVTWTNTVPNPGVNQSSPGSVKAGARVTWNVQMSSGSFARLAASRITGTSQWVAAGSYTVVEKLDPRAVYVASTGGGVYDSAAHTITWSLGTKDAPDALAAGGWGWSSSAGGWTARGPYYTRTVTVNYPASKFTSDPGGCDFEETVTHQVNASVTYLDPDRTTKTASQEMSHPVSCYAPFPRADLAKDSTNNASSGGTRLVNVPPDVTGLTCPASGRDDWTRLCTPGAALAPFADNTYNWTVTARNQSNLPGVAVIEDDALDQADARANRITTSSTTPAATIAWTLNNGTTGTSNGSVTAPAGTWFTKAKITSGTLAPPHSRPADTGSTPFYAYFHYTVSSSAPVGGKRTNTATATMSWPDSSLTAMGLGPVSRTIQFRETPRRSPDFTADFPSPAVVEGGGNAVPGKDVTFGVRGRTANIPGEVNITPQYVFIAPVGWTIKPDSASFAEGTVPDGVTFDHTTKTVGGSSREVVVATWPNDVSFGENGNWPNLAVVARPGYSVAAGTRSVAHTWMGDSRHTWTDVEAAYGSAVQDAPDVDGDGATAEWFASASQTVNVSAADGLSALKEICRPTAGAPDGCVWVSNPDVAVPVSPTASDLRYRVTLENTGNTTLSGVVAYDVLPYAGDKGTSSGTASTPRGSTFSQTLGSVSGISPNLTLAYSASTNPQRDEVYPAAPGAVDDWGPVASGRNAIRATVPGDLAPGGTAAFSFTAAVASGAAADAVACNSVALDSAQTLPAEPRPVCATTQEADLLVSVPDRLPLQVGRPGVLPFTVTNGGGSRQTPARVAVSVPAGLTVTDLEPNGWDCTADPATSPLNGPVTLTCAPVDGAGPGTLRKGVPVALHVPVVPAAAGRICVPAAVTGPMYDPEPANNETTGCLQSKVATPGLSLAKTDGRTAVSAGEEYTYTLTAASLLPAEKITGAMVTDTLPAGLAFVSATDGGRVSDQGAADAYGQRPGGTVTWQLPDLAPAAAVSPDGDKPDGGTGATAAVEVTVRVLAGATGAVVNTARVAAPDPADEDAQLSATAVDTDELRMLALTKTSDITAAGVSAGDTVIYTVTAKNTGGADYTETTPAVVTDDLAGVLDDAAYTAGSGSATGSDGFMEPIADPDSGILSWSGPLRAGASVTLTYRVTVGGDGDRTLDNAAFGGLAGSVCNSTTGRDATGVPCAATSDGFAPTLTKTVDSTTQNDNGTWTAVYGIGVTNPNPERPVSYDLADDLRFGAGIDIAAAEVTSTPSGVTAQQSWSGSGAVAADVELPGGTTHRWTLTVTADAHGLAGTAAGICVGGADSGFANQATITLADSTTRTADVCAQPVKPSLAKTMDGKPTRNEDGSWSIPYRITVTNPHTAPATGLSYRLDDRLAFPKGVKVLAVTADTGEAPVNPGFTAGLGTIRGAAVTPDSALLTGADRVPAATAAGPGTRDYRVTVTARARAIDVLTEEVRCGYPAGRGYGSAVELSATDTVIATASACTDITVPKLHFTKDADTRGPVHPGDTITYTITARNVGDADFVAGDPATVSDDMTGVLRHAGFSKEAKASAGTVVVGETRLLWSAPIRSGEAETLTYSVTVNKTAAKGAEIVNSLSAIGIEPAPGPGTEPGAGPSTGPSRGTGTGPGTATSGSPGTHPGSMPSSGSGGSQSGGPGTGPGARPGEQPEACPAKPSDLPGGACVVTTSVTPKPDSWLANTGTKITSIAALGLLALVTGAATVLSVRRRRVLRASSW
ncbi:DUF11 domain-containing protein [Streptomyces albipurpureus]|uniref:DUF11 domain-containing protein n=1 Tax=Streptomyces albipurpureus TaxID=2897419 RepID=A0ABT0UIK7_9ACTN|nr:DUF11 domain-containing protein [Streptomyces sp. CWNU-1]MCM2387278.1 DUF11 domain-containing protein [Streptomyces sp. CWNU-1]